MRSVDHESHQATSNETGDGDGHDPGEEQETDSLPVDGLVGSVAETDTDGSTCNAHGCRDGELVLREDEDSDGGTHFHGGSTRWGVVGDLVTHDLHDVVSIGNEPETDSEGHDGDLPERNIGLGGDGLTGGPGTVHTSPDSNSISDIVGSVSE